MNIMPMKPIVDLSIGDKICPKFVIDSHRVKHWKYSDECPIHQFNIPTWSVLEIFELNPIPGLQWVKAYLPNTHNTMYLKISGEELSWNFNLVN